jgi:hypothetical protein
MTTLKTGLACGYEIFNSQITDDQELVINKIVATHLGINESDITWLYITMISFDEYNDGFPYLLLPDNTMVILDSAGHPEAGYEIELEIFTSDHPSRSDCRWPYHHGYHAYQCGFYGCENEDDFLNAEEIAAYKLGKQEALTAPAYA